MIRDRTKGRMTYKAFKELLNEKYGLVKDAQGDSGQFRAIKRKYGDYLYSQDKEMFLDNYRRYYEDPNFSF